MTVGTDVIQSVLKLIQLPDRQSFTGWADLLKRIPELYAVEIPSGITNVTIGPTTPSDSERDHLWFRVDNSSNFIGLYLYLSGAWRQIYPLPNQLFFMVGDSRDIPDGFTLASADPRVSPNELAAIQKIWAVGGTAPDWYSTFHVTFTGF